MSYVVAFNRDRDFYQVPLGLHEHGLLDKLVTDFYWPDSPLLRRLPVISRMGHRHIEGFPSNMTVSRLDAAAWQVIAPRLRVTPYRTFRETARILSRAAGDIAERHDADLFLYSECAFEAFTAPSARSMAKGLFFFHPHTRLIRETLLADFEKHPECGWSVATDFDMAQPAVQAERLDEEWRRADFIVVASSFTERSLRHAGCGPEKITVVPYGIDVESVLFSSTSRSADEACKFLFVGQGLQRKGLHHLLKAWRKLALPDARLTVVASVIDPGIAALAGPGVTLLSRQTRQDLWRLYRAHHVFVMPSLVEGFGLVYLEALAAGCYCIGTANTGLPDLGTSSAEAYVVAPGDIDALAAALEAIYLRHRNGDIDHRAIRGFAERRNWSSFRSEVAELARKYARRRI